MVLEYIVAKLVFIAKLVVKKLQQNYVIATSFAIKLLTHKVSLIVCCPIKMVTMRAM
jgi:hypothetical protein